MFNNLGTLISTKLFGKNIGQDNFDNIYYINKNIKTLYQYAKMEINELNYYELEPEENIFSDIVADVTHQCNMTCKNCYIPNRDVPDMDIDRMIDCINRFPNRTMIRIIGAEPTMRNDLLKIIERIRATGHRCTLLTNGLKLASNKYVARLKKARLSHVYISLNGVDNNDWYEDMHDGNYLLHEDFIKYFGEKNISSVLEVGCGTGVYPIRKKELFTNKYSRHYFDCTFYCSMGK